MFTVNNASSQHEILENIFFRSWKGDLISEFFMSDYFELKDYMIT